MKEEIYVNTMAENLIVTKEAASLLGSISKWTKFLAILAFILLGLMVLSILGVGITISSINAHEMRQGMFPYNPGVFSWAYAILYILVLCVYAIPFYYLYNFSSKVKKAVDTNNVAALTDSFRFLEKHYLFIGIVTIIWLIFMVIGIIMMIIGMSGGM